MMLNEARALYVSYFGLREPLVQRQVVPYLEGLRRSLAAVNLLTFEPADPASWNPVDRESHEARLKQLRIGWDHLRYHKRPSLPATALDILIGALRIANSVRESRIDVVHCRGHVPMTMATLANKIVPTKLLFDIRGFMPDEYVDAGIWRDQGLTYRLAKRVEDRLFSSADAFIVLTQRARAHLFPGKEDRDDRGRPVAVIPCCVDASVFQTADTARVIDAKRRLGVEGRRVYVYSGQLGGWYLDEVLVALLRRARKHDPAAYALILTNSPSHELRRRFVAHGFSESNFMIASASPNEVPQFLAAADVGLSLIKPCFSKISSSPTKIAEYLAMGLPVVSTAGIGDTDQFITKHRAGRILTRFNDEAYDEVLASLERLLLEEDLRTRLRDLALTHFSLESIGHVQYRRLYERLLGGEKLPE